MGRCLYIQPGIRHGPDGVISDVKAEISVGAG